MLEKAKFKRTKHRIYNTLSCLEVCVKPGRASRPTDLLPDGQTEREVHRVACRDEESLQTGDYQLINVPDFNGMGESQPSPFFYQNLAEAEYIVAVFMYMRLIGYPAEKISILTTYNGQKSLLKDVCIARCAGNPLIGMPHKIVIFTVAFLN